MNVYEWKINDNDFDGLYKISQSWVKITAVLVYVHLENSGGCIIMLKFNTLFDIRDDVKISFTLIHWGSF